MFLQRNAHLTHVFHHYFAFLQHREEFQDPEHLQGTIEILDGLLERNAHESNCLELRLCIDKKRRDLPLAQDTAQTLYRPQEYLKVQGIPDSGTLDTALFTLYQASQIRLRPDLRPYGIQFVQFHSSWGIDIYCAVDVGLHVPYILCLYLDEIQDIALGNTRKQNVTPRIVIKQKK